MIQPLRQRHRRIFLALGLVLPLAFVSGIAARKPVPQMTALPSKLVATPQTYSAPVWARADLFAQSLIQVRLRRESAAAGGYAVEFSAPNDFIQPDLMVYWAAGNPSPTEALPDNAQWLGAFSSRAIKLPESATTQAGTLIFYSLANHEIMARSKPFQFIQPITP